MTIIVGSQPVTLEGDSVEVERRGEELWLRIAGYEWKIPPLSEGESFRVAPLYVKIDATLNAI